VVQTLIPDGMGYDTGRTAVVRVVSVNQIGASTREGPYQIQSKVVQVLVQGCDISRPISCGNSGIMVWYSMVLVRVVYQQTRVVSVLGFGEMVREPSAKEGREKEMAGERLNPRS